MISLIVDMFMLALILGAAVFILAATWGIVSVVRGVKPEPKLATFDKNATENLWPCPRCSNKYVTTYSNGYFTCGGCGARGSYPFYGLEDRKLRLHRK